MKPTKPTKKNVYLIKVINQTDSNMGYNVIRFPSNHTIPTLIKSLSDKLLQQFPHKRLFVMAICLPEPEGTKLWEEIRPDQDYSDVWDKLDKQVKPNDGSFAFDLLDGNNQNDLQKALDQYLKGNN